MPRDVHGRRSRVVPSTWRSVRGRLAERFAACFGLQWTEKLGIRFSLPVTGMPAEPSKGRRLMKSMNELDTPMFRLAVAQFDQAAELMGLDRNLRERLKLPRPFAHRQRTDSNG